MRSPSVQPAAAASLHTLLERLERFGGHQAPALRVLRVLDDADASAAHVAGALGADPGLAARLLRVANSPYYGLSGRVGTLAFAVSVVGFTTVRSLAVAAAAGCSGPGSAPPGFWRHAATTACAAELLAPVLGAAPADAFSLGLLHDLGTALLHRADATSAASAGADVSAAVPGAADPLAGCDRLDAGDAGDAGDAAMLAAERARFGITHEEVGARVLAAWHLPPALCTIIGRHHAHLLPDADPLERTLHAARALTARALVARVAAGPGAAGESRDPDTGAGVSAEVGVGAGVGVGVDERSQRTLARLSTGVLTPAAADILLEQLRPRADALLVGFES